MWSTQHMYGYDCVVCLRGSAYPIAFASHTVCSHLLLHLYLFVVSPYTVSISQWTKILAPYACKNNLSIRKWVCIAASQLSLSILIYTPSRHVREKNTVTTFYHYSHFSLCPPNSIPICVPINRGFKNIWFIYKLSTYCYLYIFERRKDL